MFLCQNFKQIFGNISKKPLKIYSYVSHLVSQNMNFLFVITFKKSLKYAFRSGKLKYLFDSLKEWIKYWFILTVQFYGDIGWDIFLVKIAGLARIDGMLVYSWQISYYQFAIYRTDAIDVRVIDNTILYLSIHKPCYCGWWWTYVNENEKSRRGKKLF